MWYYIENSCCSINLNARKIEVGSNQEKIEKQV